MAFVKTQLKFDTIKHEIETLRLIIIEVDKAIVEEQNESS